MKQITSLLVWIINLSLMIQSNSIWASQTTQAENFNNNWVYEKAIERTDGKSLVKLKLFKRYMWINKTPIPVAETTFTYLKNPQDSITLKELSEKIISTFPKNSFSAKLIPEGYSIEGNWKNINRYVRIDLIKKENQILIISSFVRSGLRNAITPEVNQLHALLRTYNGESDRKTTFLNLFRTLINEAVADGIPMGFDISSFMGASNSGSIPGTGSGSTAGLGDTSGLGGLGGLGGGMIPGIGGTDPSGMGALAGLSTLGPTLQGTNAAVTGVADSINNMSGQAGSLNTTANTLNASFNNQANALNTTANTLNASFNNQANALNTTANTINGTIITQGNAITNQAQQFNNNLADTNKIAAAQGQQFNDNWAESNKLAAKAMDPNHMAKLAFYTAAGAALGSLAVNLAIEGVTTGISFLYELFTGTKKKQLEWDDFQKAIEKWDSEQSTLVKMEEAVDNLLLAFDFFQDKNVGNDYVANLRLAVKDMSFDRDIYMEKFKDKELSLECRRVFHNASEELTDKLKEYEKLLDFADKNKVAKDNKESYFCSQLKEIQRRILATESQMQDIRLAILKAESQFYPKDTKAKEKSDKDAAQIDSDISSTLKKRAEYDKRSRVRIVDEYIKKREEWVDQCNSQKNQEGIKVREDLGFFMHLFRSGSSCRKIYEKNNPMGDIDPKIAQMFAEETKLREDLKLHANSTVDFKLSQDQMNWFTRMHMDAYCYQFAHTPKDKIPAKCSEFPEMLYSLKMSKGYDKAAKGYSQKCEDRYLDGIKKIAGK